MVRPKQRMVERSAFPRRHACRLLSPRATFAPAPMQLEINGELQEVKEGLTIRELLASLGLDRELVAVECNHRIVPRAEHPQTILNAGDSIEIVRFVGGG
jgi:thiamine biosynthesis protein ThiS